MVSQRRTKTLTDGSRTDLERRDLFDDELDEDLFRDDDEEDCYELDLDKLRNLLLRRDCSFSLLKEAGSDGDLSSGDGI